MSFLDESVRKHDFLPNHEEIEYSGNAIQTGRPLIVPDKGALLTTKEKKKKQEVLSTFTSSAIPAVVGSGYEMLFSHATIPKKATISVARRS